MSVSDNFRAYPCSGLERMGSFFQDDCPSLRRNSSEKASRVPLVGVFCSFRCTWCGEGEIQIAGTYFIWNEVYPVAMRSVFYQEEKIIVFPVGKEELDFTGAGAAHFPDIKKAIAIFGGFLKRIMWNGIFLS